MDLSLLPTPASEYNKQRTDARFTVRSANSPSYSLTRRSAVRKPRGILEEETEEARDTERCGMDTGANGTNKEEDHTVTGYQARGRSRSGVKGQQEEKEAPGLKMSTKLNQNGSADKTIRESGAANPAPESRGRTDSRRNNLSSRSRSLDWTTGERSPDRGKRGYTLSTKRGGTGGLDEKGVESGRGRVMSSVEYYNSARTSNDAPEGQMLDRASRGHTLPSRFRSQTLLGPKGGQSIQERIEKLYGSTGVGKTEDGSKPKDFSTQKSYERASGGTFPRRFSSGEKSPKQSRRSFTWAEKDTSGSESHLSPGTCKTADSLPRGQWQGQTQSSRYSEGSKWLEGTGTMSLDRARSRYTVAAQIRSSRAAQSNTLSEEGRSDLSRLRERREGESKDQGWANHPEEKGKTNALNNTFRDRRGWLKEQEKENETELKSSSTDEDVFESNPQKNTMKTIDRKKVPERVSVSTAASVKNKIHQFEALMQRSQGLATGQVLMPRRAFSVPTQLSRAHDGVKKSGSAKAIGGLRDKWESLKEGEEEKEEEKATGAGKTLGSGRSLSVDEAGLSLARREKEGNDLVEKKEKDTDKVNNSAEDFDTFSRLRSTLEIPLDGGSQRRRRNFYIDETDFSKASSPEEASKRSPSSLPSSSSDTSTGVQKTTIVTSPVSDEDKTPTNTPDHSPFRPPTAQPENPTPVAGSEKGSTSVLEQAAKTPDQESLPLPRPLATSSHSNLPDLVSPHISPNRKKRVLDLDAWVAGLNPDIKVWNDDEDDEDDDESTQKDEDSNYDSDSGESSVTVTSYMSQSDRKSFCIRWVLFVLSDFCFDGSVPPNSQWELSTFFPVVFQTCVTLPELTMSQRTTAMSGSLRAGGLLRWAPTCPPCPTCLWCPVRSSTSCWRMSGAWGTTTCRYTQAPGTFHKLCCGFSINHSLAAVALVISVGPPLIGFNTCLRMS